MPLTNFGQVCEGFTRSAQPRDPAAYRELMYLGVSRIYKLDKESEYPIERERGNFPTGEVVDSTVSQLLPDKGEVLAVVQAIHADLTGGKHVHAHCIHGTDRTGLICAAYQIVVMKVGVGAALEQRSAFGTTWYGDLLWDHNIVSLLRSLG
jgi:hypothetical protein